MADRKKDDDPMDPKRGRPPFEFPPGMRAGLVGGGDDYEVIDCPSSVVVTDEIKDDQGIVERIENRVFAGIHYLELPLLNGQVRTVICKLCRGWRKVAVPRPMTLQIFDLARLHAILTQKQTAQ